MREDEEGELAERVEGREEEEGVGGAEAAHVVVAPDHHERLQHTNTACTAS